MSKDLKVPFKIEGGNRIDDTPVHKAIREALANCLINADYYGRCGIVIKKERDCIIMENPGDVRTGKDQMLRGGISDPRNKALMKMFNMINVGERAGSGVPDIYSTGEQEGWEVPVIKEEYGPNRTILTLSFKEKQAIKTSDRKQAIKTGDKKKRAKTKENQEKIILYLKEKELLKTSDISEVLGLSVARTRAILNNMVKEGLLEAIGSNKKRVYRKNKKDDKKVE
ncbi:ATP-binding protein [Aequitasia blattaphilus]|uniref:Winged helix-turn-helix transcriptional regulator n=1 Tax=Aequitasia blattaphilus TaxID=2949332 RepID=A0ABT1ECX6_9FIRM|nr:ATP-binding protein [Aequitasia blattaphilus]MCP1103693.1 winged helix-turn-helix transcriptional regulator [Aequitasia blattaphilus]MCR8616333.1 winged helix-turn-helix transcriptional regulator [Aequitasia blattaphilus]